MDYFNSIVTEIKNFRDKELPQIISRLRKNVNDFKFLTKIVATESVNVSIPKDWELIAIDGGCDLTRLEGIAFAIATAQSFTLNFSEKHDEEECRKLKLFPFDPKGDLRLTTSLRMKTQEIIVATEALEHSKSSKTMVFFDGSFSFPDTSVSITKHHPDLSKAYNDYVEAISKFFELVETQNERMVIPISISKDTRAAKYFTNLLSNVELQTSCNISTEELGKIQKLLENNGWKERAIIQAVIRENYFDQNSACYLPPISIEGNNSAMHGNYPIDYLIEKKVLGSYFLYPNAKKSFYFEFPGNVKPYFKEILSILIITSRLSPLIGYPFPLVYVDKLTRLSKDLSSKMFTQLILEVKKAPNFVKELISEQLREDLH